MIFPDGARRRRSEMYWVLLAAVLASAGSAGAGLIARVFDAETGRPLAGAWVRADKSDIIAVTDTAGECLLVARTDPNSYVIASAHRYFADSVRVGPAGDTSPRQIGLYSDVPRSVRGMVRDAGSRLPLADAAVFSDKVGARALTDAGGGFFLSGLRTGSLTLVAELAGYPPESVRVAMGAGETATVEIGLRDTANVGTLTGVVSDRQTGLPVAGARLTVEATGLETTSDSSGNYALTGVPVGIQRLSIVAPGYTSGYVRFRMLRDWAVTANPRLRPEGAEKSPGR